MSEALIEVASRRPLLAPWYRLVQEPDRLLLEHGGSLVTLEGKAAGLLLPRLVPLLDGTRTVEQIVDQLGPAIEPSIRRALTLLDEHGLIIDGQGVPIGSSGEAALFAAAVAVGTPAPALARERLGQAGVGVAGRSPAAGEVARLLDEAGVGRVERGGPELAGAGLDLLVAAPDRTETELLLDVNSRAVEAEQAWLQVIPHDGRVVVVGPLFLPGRSACHECYRLRRAAASDYEDDFELVERVPGRGAEPAALTAVSAGIATLFAIRWLASADPTLPGRASTIRTRGLLETETHHVLRVPRCPSCGTGLEALPSPWFKQGALDA